MAITKETIDRVRERVSLVDVVSEVVELKRSGSRHAGLCPFHAEKTASFFVNEEQGVFHCFGCGKKGSAFDFIMATRGFSFPEAVRYLASRVGIEIEEESSESSERRKNLARHVRELRQVVAWSADIYRTALLNGRSGRMARDYLADRGISDAISEKFSLGFAPAGRGFLLGEIVKIAESQAQGGRVAVESIPALLLEAGLIRKSSIRRTLGGEKSASAEPERATRAEAPEDYYDFLRERLVFPITRSDGQPLAFGGRIMRKAEGIPKYINSCESLVYSKRKAFFGLFQALPEIRRKRAAVLVEGYMDVLSVFAAGLEDCLAACGTAVTQEHVLNLKRLVDRVTVVFDGDMAGRRAASRCFEVFLNSGVEVEAVLLPEGMDPDSIVRERGSAEFKQLMSELRKPIFDVWLNSLFFEAGAGDQAGAVVKGRIAARASEVVSRVKNPVEREALLGRASELLGVSAESLLALSRAQPRKKVSVSVDYTSSKAEVKGSRQREVRTRAGEKPRGRVCLSLYEQLIVACLSAPQLARSALDIPSLTELPSLPEQDEAKRFRSLLEELSQVDFGGIEPGTEIPLGDARWSEVLSNTNGLARVVEILSSYGFNGRELFCEAVRQTSVGGVSAKKVVDSADSAFARLSIINEVEQIKTRENTPGDFDRLELAQEKLLSRRRLDKRNVIDKRA